MTGTAVRFLCLITSRSLLTGSSRDRGEAGAAGGRQLGPARRPVAAGTCAESAPGATAQPLCYVRVRAWGRRFPTSLLYKLGTRVGREGGLRGQRTL